MERFRRVLRIGDVTRPPGVKVYSVKQIDEMLRKHKSEGGNYLQGKTIGVDFSETPSFTDPNEATMCIVVLTSNGRTGTLSHLPPETENISELTDSLLAYHGEPASAIFVGGAYQVSDRLLVSLYNELGSRGFATPSSMNQADIGGVLNNRVATLYPESVVVKKYFDDRSPEQVQLKFPNRTAGAAFPDLQG